MSSFLIFKNQHKWGLRNNVKFKQKLTEDKIYSALMIYIKKLIKILRFSCFAQSRSLEGSIQTYREHLSIAGSIHSFQRDTDETLARIKVRFIKFKCHYVTQVAQNGLENFKSKFSSLLNSLFSKEVAIVWVYLSLDCRCIERAGGQILRR